MAMRRIVTAVGGVLALGLAGCGADSGTASPATPSSPTSPSPSAPPTKAVPGEGAPVWWDQDGLHRGDVVENTAVPLLKDRRAHLALVRSGALYRDQRNGDLWFHPWGGTPRVVGHATMAGAGGDPEGDTAAWFDDRDLVVYDTAQAKVVSRTREGAVVSPSAEYVEHVGHGNGWVYVSAAQVVWRYASGAEETTAFARRDLVTGTTDLSWQPLPASRARAKFVDVSRDSAVWTVGDVYGGKGAYLYDRAGSTRTGRVRNLEGPARLSPDGTWLLTAELADGTHGVAFTDLRTGRVWKPFAKAVYAFYSWAYGDVAVMRTEFKLPSERWTLTGCSMTERKCEQLKTRGEVVILPNP